MPWTEQKPTRLATGIWAVKRHSSGPGEGGGRGGGRPVGLLAVLWRGADWLPLGRALAFCHWPLAGSATPPRSMPGAALGSDTAAGLAPLRRRLRWLLLLASHLCRLGSWVQNGHFDFEF